MTFSDYVTEALGKPFAWGSHDCVLFAVGWLEKKSGRDLLSPYLPWTTEAEAMAVIKRVGGLRAQFDANLLPISVGFACDGDITIVGKTVYLFSGNHIVGPGKNGLMFKDRAEAKCAWSI